MKTWLVWCFSSNWCPSLRDWELILDSRVVWAEELLEVSLLLNFFFPFKKLPVTGLSDTNS